MKIRETLFDLAFLCLEKLDFATKSTKTQRRNFIVDCSGSMTDGQIDWALNKVRRIQNENDRVFLLSSELKEIDPCEITTAKQIRGFHGMHGGLLSTFSMILLPPRILISDGDLSSTDMKYFDQLIYVPRGI